MLAQENILNVEQFIFGSAGHSVERVFFAELRPLGIAQAVKREKVDLKQSQALHESGYGLDVIVRIVEIFDHREAQNQPSCPVVFGQGLDIVQDQIIRNAGLFAMALRIHVFDINKSKINPIHQLEETLWLDICAGFNGYMNLGVTAGLE